MCSPCLYLHKAGVRSAYILCPPNPTWWDYTEFVVVIVLPCPLLLRDNEYRLRRITIMYEYIHMYYIFDEVSCFFTGIK